MINDRTTKPYWKLFVSHLSGMNSCNYFMGTFTNIFWWSLNFPYTDKQNTRLCFVHRNQFRWFGTWVAAAPALQVSSKPPCTLSWRPRACLPLEQGSATQADICIRTNSHPTSIIHPTPKTNMCRGSHMFISMFHRIYFLLLSNVSI